MFSKNLGISLNYRLYCVYYQVIKFKFYHKNRVCWSL